MKGFSLIEVLVAMLVIMIGVVTAMQVFLKQGQQRMLHYQQQFAYIEATFMADMARHAQQSTAMVSHWRQHVSDQLPDSQIKVGRHIRIQWYIHHPALKQQVEV